ncbi:MAG: two-component system cell cycle response regulator [Verrucomicrobiales bacterium]|jgi:two-component system cell cycle response regulator
MKKRILIIDDDKEYADTLQANLERSGEFDVRTINYSPRSVSVGKIVQPDLILLDFIMPDKNGAEVLAELQAQRKLGHVPVIICTALSEIPDRESLSGDVKAIFRKPVKFSELLDKIRSLVNQSVDAN